MARYRCCIIQLDRMDSAGLLFCSSAVREFMLDDQKKYKIALWISGSLPLLLYCCEFFTRHNEYLEIFFEYSGYGIITIFALGCAFYEFKFKKKKIMDAICNVLFISVTIFILKPLIYLLLFWSFVK